ncbi:MAG TPA: peptidylprolyl isomerase [Planctomycetota bacterium]|nr:peptidylprolyl isomerase [Planctomycetota bacterium]
MLAGLLLQVSMFVAPLYRDAQPPESRSVRAMTLAWDRSPKEKEAAARETASQLAKELAVRLRAGSDFDELCARARAAQIASGGAVLGTYFPGMLAPPIDQFLFHAAEFEVSDPIETETGFQVLQRIDRLAGCRSILIASSDSTAHKRAEDLLQRLSGGADFAELARTHSEDADSASRGGALGIFERGPSDRLLKAAVFRLKPGEVSGPLESPLGLHLIQRVEPASLDPKLADDTVARVRLILIAFAGARGAGLTQERSHEAAERLSREILARIRAGEDMAELAARYDDDSGGRERRGDAGWIRRRTPQIHADLDRVFTLRVGETTEPIATNAGWLLIRRER